MVIYKIFISSNIFFNSKHYYTRRWGRDGFDFMSKPCHSLGRLKLHLLHAAVSIVRHYKYEKGVCSAKIGANHYHTQLSFPDKGRAIKGLVG